LKNYFNDFLFIIPTVISLYYSWFFFLKINLNFVRIAPSYSDKLLSSNILKKHTNNLFLKFSITIVFYIYMCFYLFRGFVKNILFNHNYVNNFNINIVLFCLTILLISYFIFLNTKYQNLLLNNDYYFSILNISIFIPYLFFSNSIFNFIFILEVISILIFYKFVVKKFLYKKKKDFFKKKNINEKIFSKNYTNVLFFQYWVNFFSSVILIISVINIMCLYGSTDWFLLNLINLLNNNIFYTVDFEFNVLVWSSFFLSFFLKIGLTPSHLFKIEVYKGVPFMSIFFYTTFYFLSYFILFTMMVQVYLNSFKINYYWIFIIFIIIGLVFTITLLFDIKFTKAFFAYSTVVNTISFFILIINNL